MPSFVLSNNNESQLSPTKNYHIGTALSKYRPANATLMNKVYKTAKDYRDRSH